MQKHPPIILASASPRRLQLLRGCGLPFTVKPSHIEETTPCKLPFAIVRDLALQKARSVAGGLRKGIVIGADTIVVLNGRIIGKPSDEEDAHGYSAR